MNGAAGSAGHGAHDGDAAQAMMDASVPAPELDASSSVASDAAIEVDASSSSGSDAAIEMDAAQALDAGSDAGGQTGDAGVDAATATMTYTIGGTVTGLTSGTVTLQNGGGDDLMVMADGQFEFATPLADGAGYGVSVYAQPLGLYCDVTNSNGTVMGADVSNVNVTCNAGYSVNGTISGLVGSILVKNNGFNAHQTTVNGPFGVAVHAPSGTKYDVQVGSAPAEQDCVVTNGTGTITNADVNDIQIVCTTKTYGLSGMVSGLSGAESVTLQNNGTDDVMVSAPGGAFSFPTALPAGASYAVSVSSAPAGKTCSVSNGTGNIASVAVSNITVVCSSTTYKVGGMASGVTSPVVLQNNGGDDLTVSGDGAFTFATQAPSGADYAVTVHSSGLTSTCAVTSGNGKVGNAPVNTVQLTCSPAKARFAFVAGGSAVQSFGIDGSAHTLSSSANLPIYTINGLAISADGAVLYGSNQPNDGVNIFDVNPTTGVLTPRDADTMTAGVQPVAAGDAPSSLTLHPTGKWLYVTNYTAGSIAAFSVAGDGSLTRLDFDGVTAGQQDLTVGTGPYSVVVTPNGKYLYAVLANGGGIVAYSIDGSTGLLTALSGIPYDTSALSALSLTIRPQGDRAYLSSYFGDGVYMFTVGADGALTLVNPKFPAGSRPRAPLAFAAGTPYAYLTNTSSNNVTAYSADAATGALTQLSGSPTPAGTYPNSLTAHPDGKALYVLNNSSNDISSYAIGSNGTLSKLWTGNVAAPQSPYAIAITP